MAKFLDTTGLTHFWAKIKTLLAGKSNTDHTHDYFNEAVTFKDGIVFSNGGKAANVDYSGTDDQINVSSKFYVAGDINVDGNILNGGQRYADLFAERVHYHDEYANQTQIEALDTELTALSQNHNALTSTVNSKAEQSALIDLEARVMQKLSATYNAKGSSSTIPTLANCSTGDVYNITVAFTTTSDFAEGAGKQYPAGTNIVKTSDGKWDVLAGFVDTSVFATYGAMSAADQVLQDQIDAIEAVTGAIDSITTTEIDNMMK